MRHRKRDTLYLLNVEYELILFLLYEDGVVQMGEERERGSDRD